ncbi:MAG: CoA-binding protein [Cyclobacteriaceae bacterium]
MKKTVLIGATTNPTRYAYLAGNRLTEHGHDLVPIGIRKGMLADKEILDLRLLPKVENVDTVTLYIGPKNLLEWEEYVLSLHPKRIIFNPGTENYSFRKKVENQGIEALEACTLVMLSAGTY